jgi:Sec-independent protein translocase protein TatA
VPIPGFADLILISIVVLVIFTASKLPQIATAVGKVLVNLKQRSTDPDDPESPPSP